MRPSGILLLVAGAWVLSQILAGDALGRLGITGATTKSGSKDTAPSSGFSGGSVGGSSSGGGGGGGSF